MTNHIIPKVAYSPLEYHMSVELADGVLFVFENT